VEGEYARETFSMDPKENEAGNGRGDEINDDANDTSRETNNTRF